LSGCCSRFFLSTPLILRAEATPVNQTRPASSSPLDWNSPGKSPRGLALELAAGNAGEGYQVHDGFWSGTLSSGVPVLIEVYLFAGNDYRFSAANLDAFSQLKLSIFDQWGYPAGTEYSGNSSCSTAGITVIRSGRYYIRLVMTESDNTDTCMVYSYK
jgi:hypothetical protein